MDQLEEEKNLDPAVKAASRRLWREMHSADFYIHEKMKECEDEELLPVEEVKVKELLPPAASPAVSYISDQCDPKKFKKAMQSGPVKESYALKRMMTIPWKTVEIPGMQSAIKAGGKLDYRNPDYGGQTLFIREARMGELATLMYLDALGAEKAMVDFNNRSALHWAALEGYAKVVQWLLEKIPPEMVDMRDDNGDSALHFAARMGHLPIVRLLVRANADPEALNNANQTPMSIAASWCRHHIVKFLEDCKKNPDKEAKFWTDMQEAKLSDVDRKFQTTEALAKVKQVGANQIEEFENFEMKGESEKYSKEVFEFKGETYTKTCKGVNGNPKAEVPAGAKLISKRFVQNQADKVCDEWLANKPKPKAPKGKK